MARHLSKVSAEPRTPRWPLRRPNPRQRPTKPSAHIAWFVRDDRYPRRLRPPGSALEPRRLSLLRLRAKRVGCFVVLFPIERGRMKRRATAGDVLRGRLGDRPQRAMTLHRLRRARGQDNHQSDNELPFHISLLGVRRRPASELP